MQKVINSELTHGVAFNREIVVYIVDLVGMMPLTNVCVHE